MIIFAVGNINHNNNKFSQKLAYMQMRRMPPELIKANVAEFSSPHGDTLEGATHRLLAEIQPKKVTQTLRKMTVGQTEYFPVEQRTTLMITANRIKRELARYGWDYECKDDDANYAVALTRTR